MQQKSSPANILARKHTHKHAAFIHQQHLGRGDFHSIYNPTAVLSALTSSLHPSPVLPVSNVAALLAVWLSRLIVHPLSLKTKETSVSCRAQRAIYRALCRVCQATETSSLDLLCLPSLPLCCTAGFYRVIISLIAAHEVCSAAVVGLFSTTSLCLRHWLTEHQQPTEEIHDLQFNQQ